ncbi:hypothetical protein PHSY_002727 [Pseudozyma hubeiensis SY62]|uniref:Cyclase n=1 Tax=Pseudozyma hubeiensis (strain SY62) TaxID=1305764 RepID=R9P1V5_PSEHS|nr:hypothetical protein PHSY_002727 [Pseudozyma hubeiensis SY62]GAC95152.1 hypothetical protein PHSY_002727 [Pseudozyma hubeiensis SY62]
MAFVPAVICADRGSSVFRPALNFLTDENTKNAMDNEIHTGKRVQLDWSLDKMTFPGFGRKKGEHKLIDLGFLGVTATDDMVTFNTQQSSQWDGLRHFAHQQSKMLYNGVPHDDIHADRGNLRLGIHNWVDNGGIAGRGVLIDWASWAASRNGGQTPRPDQSYTISLADLQACLEQQGTELKHGDLLLIRTGFVAWHDIATQDQLREQQESGASIGLAQDPALVEWLWDNHFSAVAADNPALEVWPPQGQPLHEFLIALWGCPIGELWNLEKLAELCREHKRWSFFLTSSPLNIPGGVASPPNAMAIF